MAEANDKRVSVEYATQEAGLELIRARMSLQRVLELLGPAQRTDLTGDVRQLKDEVAELAKQVIQ